MAINTKGFTDLVRGQVAAIQASAAGLVDFTVGSILRAVVEAGAQVFLWLQGLILALLGTTRAATSTGTDLDTWMADFGLTRLPAVTAKGILTFTRFTATAQGFVPVGAGAELSDGSIQFTVTADPTNPNFSPDLNGYVIAAMTASVDVPAAASVAGVAGNAAAGQINTIVSPIAGIDTVTNAASFSGGEDAESDAAFRARFVLYLASLAEGTVAAIEFAIGSVQQGIKYSITENFDYDGTPDRGHFSVVIDDGSGTASTDLINAVSTAVEAVRPITVDFEVHAVTPINITLAMTIVVRDGYVVNDVVNAVKAALISFVNTTGLDAGIDYTRIPQVAYDANPGVKTVQTGYLLNGTTANLAPVANSAYRTSSGSVSVAHT